MRLSNKIFWKTEILDVDFAWEEGEDWGEKKMRISRILVALYLT